MSNKAPLRRVHAYVDEAGDRAARHGASRYYVASAALVDEAHEPDMLAFLVDLKAALGRLPHHKLHFRKLTPERRVTACDMLGAARFLTIFNVVVCTDEFIGHASPMSDDRIYNFTLKLLLERLSWYAAQTRAVLSYTLEQVGGNNSENVRSYEAKLQADPTCRIEWGALDLSSRQRFASPKLVPGLQLADIAASATFHAFEPDADGPGYLTRLERRLYCPPRGLLHRYGLKMHPWNERTSPDFDRACAAFART